MVMMMLRSHVGVTDVITLIVVVSQALLISATNSVIISSGSTKITLTVGFGWE